MSRRAAGGGSEHPAIPHAPSEPDASRTRAARRETGAPQQDYLLGTRDDEVERLGLQHRVWRPFVLSAWRRAGISAGSRVLDLGAGPGYATVDLAEIVGPKGRVVAVERSPRFVAVAREACARRGLANVEFVEADLMAGLPDLAGFDAAWCRWVAAFVASPERLVATIRGALRADGAAVFHEYAAYDSWRLAPRGAALESFVAAAVRSWRESGGEPNVGLALPGLLAEAGLRLRRRAPLVFVAGPGDPMWRWCAAFVEAHLARELEQGRAASAWAASVRDELRAAESGPSSFMITPLVMEIIARRSG
jgi:SAM-dependent methyltransferase